MNAVNTLEKHKRKTRLGVLLLFLMVFAMNTMIVKAQNIEDLKLKWTSQIYGNLNGKGLVIKDYYYSFSSNRIEKHSRANGFEKEISLPEGYINNYAEYNDKIIILITLYDKTEYNQETKKYTRYHTNYFYVLDKDLNILKKIEFESSPNYYTALWKQEENIYTYKYNDGLYKVDENLRLEKSNDEIQEENDYYELHKIFQTIIEEKYQEQDDVEISDITITEDGQYLIAYFHDTYNIDTKKYTKQAAMMSYYNEKKEEIFTKEIYQIDTNTSYNDYHCSTNNTIGKIENHIIVSFLDKEYIPHIYVYDEKGEKIKELELNSEYQGLIPSYIFPMEKGVIIALESGIAGCEESVSIQSGAATFLTESTTPQIQPLYARNRSVLLYYEFPYEITTKTDGNGEIKATKTKAESGEEVEFTIIPKEGFVLGAVKVTDTAGNVVTFTDYKFTMPSADVTIEATFVPENPNTKDIAVISLFIGAAFFIIILIQAKKREKWLTK